LKLFPDAYYAIAVPVFFGILLLAGTLVTLGGLLIQGELSKAFKKPAKAKAP